MRGQGMLLFGPGRKPAGRCARDSELVLMRSDRTFICENKLPWHPTSVRAQSCTARSKYQTSCDCGDARKKVSGQGCSGCLSRNIPQDAGHPDTFSFCTTCHARVGFQYRTCGVQLPGCTSRRVRQHSLGAAHSAQDSLARVASSHTRQVWLCDSREASQKTSERQCCDPGSQEISG